MRLFFAICFTDEIKTKLETVSDALYQQSRRGRFVPVENLHLTLAFLGECDEVHATAAKAVLSSLEFMPFSISFDQTGCFKRKGGDTWWAGIYENPELLKLQAELSSRLIAVGFRLEDRAFTPHITLARDVKTGAKPWQIDSIDETVCSVDLMKSEVIDGRIAYIKLASRQSV
ncbi:MAG: RNA 2',3'-cyclic phosphodiesterase [Coriobacteriales bacterium]|jgi:2'-5' RNA ligase|nr:RNA 2',3'-cyclic phosphodiesterase [Coriobacteriales bacterium]